MFFMLVMVLVQPQPIAEPLPLPPVIEKLGEFQPFDIDGHSTDKWMRKLRALDPAAKDAFLKTGRKAIAVLCRALMDTEPVDKGNNRQVKLFAIEILLELSKDDRLAASAGCNLLNAIYWAWSYNQRPADDRAKREMQKAIEGFAAYMGGKAPEITPPQYIAIPGNRALKIVKYSSNPDVYMDDILVMFEPFDVEGRSIQVWMGKLNELDPAAKPVFLKLGRKACPALCGELRSTSALNQGRNRQVRSYILEIIGELGRDGLDCLPMLEHLDRLIPKTDKANAEAKAEMKKAIEKLKAAR